MRLAILTPNYPPDICGVGDYSYELAKAFGGLGHLTTVFSREEEFGVGLPEPFGKRPFKEFWREFEAVEPQVVFLQYTPQLFLRPFFKSWKPLHDLVFGMRERRAKVIIVAHEVRFPFQFSKPGLVFGPTDYFHFSRLVSLADQVVFSTETMMEEWRGRRPKLGKKLGWSPVGCNVGFLEPSVETKKDLLVHFGGNHPTHLIPVVLETGRRILEVFSDLELALPGLKYHLVKEQTASWAPELKKRVVAHGFCPADEVCGLMNRARLVIQPFMDGVSTRRGSVMAALAHGRPVLSNLGWSSQGTTPWEKLLFLSKTSEVDEFSKTAVELLRTQDLLEDRGKLGQEYFRTHFSWPVIAKNLLSHC